MRSTALPSGTQFLHETTRWSVWVAPVVATAGTALTGDASWGLAAIVGAAYDVITLRIVSNMSPTPESPAPDSRFASSMLLRIVGKAALILVAVALHSVLNPWGMALGVLTAEITMLTVGPVVMTYRMLSRRGASG